MLADDDASVVSSQQVVPRVQGNGAKQANPSCPISGSNSGGSAASKTGSHLTDDLLFFRIICDNMSGHTFLGEVHNQDIDCMVQTYKIVASTCQQSTAKLETVSVTPVPTMLQGAAWFLQWAVNACLPGLSVHVSLIVL